MTDPPRNEHLPTREKLEREARRLARIRHLTVVRDEQPTSRTATPFRFSDPDPGPKAAA